MTRAPDEAAVLGIDLGTGSVRAGLYAPSGALLAAHEERVATSHPRPGWAEQSPAQVLEALHRAQLYVYRHPVEVAERLRRPPLAYKDVAKMKEEPQALPAVKKGEHARVAQWAGFILSGDGR